MDKKRQSKGLKVSAVEHVEIAAGWARLLEDREARRSGGDLDIVRLSVARKTGVPASKLRSLRKRRLKDFSVGFYERLRAGVIRELEAELIHVEHQIHIAKQTGLDPGSGEAHSLLSSREKLREALGLDT